MSVLARVTRNIRMDRHVYSNDVSTCQNISITCQCTNHRQGQRNGGGIPYGGMGTGHGYEPVYIIPHYLCNHPLITLQMSNKSPILKRYCRGHVPSAAEFALSGGWSPASTRFGVGKLVVVWGVVNTGSYSPCTAKPKGARSEEENAFGVAERRPQTGCHSICITTMF